MLAYFSNGAKGTRALVNVKAHSVSITTPEGHVLFFDQAGRLVDAFVRGQTYVRGLDNRVMEKRRSGEVGARQRRDLGEEEKSRLLAEVYDRVEELASALRAGSLRPEAGCEAAAPAALAALEGIAAFGLEGCFADRERFAAVYHPVTIMPPDQYLALVLQATEGCSYNRCTFCSFYAGRPFRIKGANEFRKHAREVKNFLGPSITLRRSIFLADANALVIPSRPLEELFAVVEEEFDLAPEGLPPAKLAQWKERHPIHFHGIYSFLDAFTGVHKSATDFARLRERHLRRVYVGIESGSDRLLRFLNKPTSASEMASVVSAIKAGGVKVGVIIMVGVGGDAYAADHVRETLRLLNNLPLERGDIIYLSEFVEHPDSAYPAKARAEGIRPFSRAEVLVQKEEIKAGLRFRASEHAPKVSTYDIREFIY